MRVTLLTHGTRGDVQPVVALGSELRRRGHEVRVAVPPNMVAFSERVGLAATRLPVDTQAFLESAQAQLWLVRNEFWKSTRALARVARDHAVEGDDAILAATEGADAIVSTFLTEERATAVAEARGIPLTLLHVNPVRRSTVIPHAALSSFPWENRAWIRLGNAAFDRYWWRFVRRDVNAFRRRLGLPEATASLEHRATRLGHQELMAFSPSFVPELAEHWPTRPLVGFLDLSPHDRAALGESGLDPALGSWLTAGPPPFFLGFGSMPILDPAGFMTGLERVVDRLGIRIVVAAGWARFPPPRPEFSDRIRVVGGVDYGAVFPFCEGVVHAGGAGTFAAALRAGLPSFVPWVLGDQPFWARQVARQGACVRMPFRAMSESDLEAGIARIRDDPSVRAGAVALGARMARDVDPVALVADRVEAHSRRGPARRSPSGGSGRRLPRVTA